MLTIMQSLHFHEIYSIYFNQFYFHDLLSLLGSLTPYLLSLLPFPLSLSIGENDYTLHVGLKMGCIVVTLIDEVRQGESR